MPAIRTISFLILYSQICYKICCVFMLSKKIAIKVESEEKQSFIRNQTDVIVQSISTNEVEACGTYCCASQHNVVVQHALYIVCFY